MGGGKCPQPATCSHTLCPHDSSRAALPPSNKHSATNLARGGTRGMGLVRTRWQSHGCPHTPHNPTAPPLPTTRHPAPGHTPSAPRGVARTFICLKMVLFPDSPAPAGVTMGVAGRHGAQGGTRRGAHAAPFPMARRAVNPLSPRQQRGRPQRPSQPDGPPAPVPSSRSLILRFSAAWSACACADSARLAFSSSLSDDPQIPMGEAHREGE